MTEMEKTVLQWLEDLAIDPSMTDWDIQNRMKEIKLGSEAAMDCGSSKICLIPHNADFVIKWTYSDPDEFTSDEALKEVDMYNKAVEAGLGMFFPKTELFCTIDGINFIKQEKIDLRFVAVPIRPLRSTRLRSKPQVTRKRNSWISASRKRLLMGAMQETQTLFGLRWLLLSMARDFAKLFASLSLKTESMTCTNPTLVTKMTAQSSQILAVLIDKRLDKDRTVWYNTGTIKERK